MVRSKNAGHSVFILFLILCSGIAACKKKGLHEVEPNDSVRDATVIEAGSPVSGTLSSSTDKDFYRLEIEEAAPFDISLSAVKGLNHAIRIWKSGLNSDPDLVKFIDDARKSSPERIRNIYMNRGIWYIEITHGDRDIPQGAPDMQYLLTVMPHEAAENEEREPNDDQDHANQIEAGKKISGYFSPSFNKLNVSEPNPLREDDWFSFRIEDSDQKKVAAIDLTGVPGVTGAFELYDAEKKMITHVEAKAPGSAVHMQDHFLSAGTYFICVHSAAYESNPDKQYYLSVSFSDYDAAKESEPNDTAESANVFNPPAMSGHIYPSGDHDFYSYAAEGPTLLRVEIAVPSSLEMTVQAFGASMNRLCESSGKGGSVIVIPDLYVSTSLYLDISAIAGKSDQDKPYQLTVTASDYTQDIEKEPNDSRDAATRFKGTAMTGYLSYKKDIDWYIYEPGKKESRTITVDGIEGASFTVSVADPAGMVIRTEKIAGKKAKSFREMFDGRGYIIIESQKEITTDPYRILLGK